MAWPPAQAKAQKGGARPISPRAASVMVQIGVISSATCRRNSGACGTERRAVLTRMKASGSSIIPALAYGFAAGAGDPVKSADHCGASADWKTDRGMVTA